MRVLQSSESDGARALVQGHVTYYNSIYRNLPSRIQGEPNGNYLEEIGGYVARFAKILEPFVKNYISEIISGRGEMKILEVGCGTGIFMKCALELNGQVNCTGIDMDQNVIDLARKNLEEWGIGDRCSAVKGDIRKPGPEFAGPFDMITLYNIIYYFPVEERAELFRSLKNMLSKDGKIALVSSTQSNGKSFGAANLDTAVRSIEGCYALPHLNQLADQLKESGFTNVKTSKLFPGDTYYGIEAAL